MDYDWITDDAFDAKLAEIISRMNGEAILQVPGVYEAMSEHFNNEVLGELEEERETSA